MCVVTFLGNKLLNFNRSLSIYILVSKGFVVQNTLSILSGTKHILLIAGQDKIY
jgi:hypothetical protein